MSAVPLFFLFVLVFVVAAAWWHFYEKNLTRFVLHSFEKIDFFALFGPFVGRQLFFNFVFYTA